MKKLMALCLSILMLASLTVGCSPKSTDSKPVSNETVASKIKESELKKMETADDMFGHLEDNVYSSECLGFSITLPSEFENMINRQDGYVYSFENFPKDWYNAEVLRSIDSDYKIALSMEISILTAVNDLATGRLEDAASVLANKAHIINNKAENDSFSTSEVEFGGKTFAKCSFDFEGIQENYYAIIINGYYIEWHDYSNDKEKELVNAALNSMVFIWE